MKKIILIAVLFIAAFVASISILYKQEVTEKKLVIESFEHYRTAALSKDGEKASQYVSSSTLDYYGELLLFTKMGNKADIKGRRLIDQVMVLMIRHLFTAPTILSIPNGKGLFELAVKHELIDKEDVIKTKIQSVSILENTASTKVINDGKVSNGFIFLKEQGIWKIDMLSVLPQANVAFEALVPKLGFSSEEDFIFYLLESISGRKPSDKIWQPLM